MKTNPVRKMTNQLIEMVDEGILDPRTVLLACLSYMSEDDVADMAEANELCFSDPEEDEESAESHGLAMEAVPGHGDYIVPANEPSNSVPCQVEVDALLQYALGEHINH